MVFAQREELIPPKSTSKQILTSLLIWPGSAGLGQKAGFGGARGFLDLMTIRREDPVLVFTLPLTHAASWSKSISRWAVACQSNRQASSQSLPLLAGEAAP